MKGKNKCKILKDIRRQIARDNDIEFVTSECKFQGDCTGTCPKCEAEVRYLEQELKKRQAAGKAVAVAGIAATLMVSSAGCLWNEPETGPLAGDVPYYESTEPEAADDAGAIPYEETTQETEPLMGEPAIEDETTLPEETEMILMGDVPLEE